jgi:predicted DNA-binding transcriptional regulator AlpA
MSRPKPVATDVIQGIINRIDTLLKNGVITKDFIINTEEVAIITGLSRETVRQYGKTGYFPAFKYPGKNLYPCNEICQWVLNHYSEKTLVNTTKINGYKPVGAKRGRPRKGAKYGGIV